MKLKEIISMNSIIKVVAIPSVLFIGMTLGKVVYNYKVLKYLKNINKKL